MMARSSLATWTWRIRHPCPAILFTWAFLTVLTGDTITTVQAVPTVKHEAGTMISMDPKDEGLEDKTFLDTELLKDQPLVNGIDPLTTKSASGYCPPVSEARSLGGCDVDQCSSDKDCWSSEEQLRCCSNGCVYTCLPEVKPPPYFDWISEPERRVQFGPSWLIPGPDDNIDVQMCSTSSADDDDDADPLVCPHGYECNIDDPGKPEAGIPNRGHCVKLADTRKLPGTLVLQAKSDPEEMLQADAPYKFTIPNSCAITNDGQVLLSGHSIIKDGRECLCLESQLKCDP